MQVSSLMHLYSIKIKLTISIIISIVLLISITNMAAHKLNATSTTEVNLQMKNKKPVIGILTQVVRDYKRFSLERKTHIASSYVKWIEAAGAQVIPIFVNQNDSYYEKIFPLTNGLLFPGGDNLLDPNRDTPMMVAAKKLYKMAINANDRGQHYPIWGTCLGLELLSVLSSGKNTLEKCSANDIRLPLNFVTRGRLFSSSNTYSDLVPDFSKTVMNALATKNLTYNYHHFCLTDAGLSKAGLTEFYRPLAYSEDINGLRFISVFEAIKYPFYGVQFHPEKPPFEFVISHWQSQVSHSREAIAISRYFADYFVESASLNNHRASVEELKNHLIYAYNASYTAIMNDIYEQRYLFPFNGGDSSTDEFLDFIPNDQGEVPEFISTSS